MSTNKMVVPGFGIGTAYGVPVTVGLAPTSTLSITSALVGAYHVTGLAAGTGLTLVSTSNGVTGTYTILSAAPGKVWLDGVSAFATSTTTSVSLIFIAT